MTSPAAIVRVRRLSRSFGSQVVLRQVDLDFETGKTTVVLGPSGTGKSVLLKHLVGLLRPSDGEVWFGDQRVDLLSERALVAIRQQFGFLFQNGALFDSLDVFENVAFPLHEHASMSAERLRERVRHVVNLVGLIDTLHKMPADLSGGQRKRIALARAIVMNPRVILYDEPTTGLDPIRSDIINELILKLQRELGATSIVVTHDLTSAFKVADRMVMLNDGRVIQHGTPTEFRASVDPVVHRFLMGEAAPEDLAAIGGPARHA